MPTSVIAVAIVVIAVLPGSMYVWAYERQASAFGVTFADRTLRFIAISLILHVALGWPEYALYRLAFGGGAFGAGQFAAAWGAVLLLVAIPAAVGTMLGGLYATRKVSRRVDAGETVALPGNGGSAAAVCAGQDTGTACVG